MLISIQSDASRVCVWGSWIAVIGCLKPERERERELAASSESLWDLETFHLRSLKEKQSSKDDTDTRGSGHFLIVHGHVADSVLEETASTRTSQIIHQTYHGSQMDWWINRCKGEWCTSLKALGPSRLKKKEKAAEAQEQQAPIRLHLWWFCIDFFCMRAEFGSSFGPVQVWDSCVPRWPPLSVSFLRASCVFHVFFWFPFASFHLSDPGCSFTLLKALLAICGITVCVCVCVCVWPLAGCHV